VSGRWAGAFKETDLDVGQRFNNFYEETKFLAEVLVAERLGGGMPASVYRPSIVVGDSTTGATQKYDGPYFVLQWLLRQRGLAVLPVMGDPTAIRLNVAPRDFVVDAIATLSADTRSKGRTYALADPRPLTIDELVTAMADATDRRVLRVPIPRKVAKFFIEKVPGVNAVLRIPSSAVDYFTHPTFYDTTTASTDLEGTGVACPELRSYLPTLVRYMQAHPHISPTAMI
jgi:thioester reductase-like protein